MQNRSSFLMQSDLFDLFLELENGLDYLSSEDYDTCMCMERRNMMMNNDNQMKRKLHSHLFLCL